MTVTVERRPARRRAARPKKPNAVPRSQTERLWLYGGVTAALLLTVVAYFFFISPQSSETSDVRSQVDTAHTQNGILRDRIDRLREQNRNLAKYQAELAAAQRALPQTSGVSDFLRSLQVLGSQTQTDVTSLSVGQPVDVSTALAGSRPSSAASSAGSSSPAVGGPAAGGPAAGGPAVGGPAASRPAGGPALYSLAITTQVAGSPAALNRFLDQLQNVQPRAVLITAITETTGAGAAGGAQQAATGGTTLQLTMQAFVAPTNPSEKASLSAAAH